MYLRCRKQKVGHEKNAERFQHNRRPEDYVWYTYSIRWLDPRHGCGPNLKKKEIMSLNTINVLGTN